MCHQLIYDSQYILHLSWTWVMYRHSFININDSFTWTGGPHAHRKYPHEIYALVVIGVTFSAFLCALVFLYLILLSVFAVSVLSHWWWWCPHLPMFGLLACVLRCRALGWQTSHSLLALHWRQMQRNPKYTLCKACRRWKQARPTYSVLFAGG